MPSPFASLTTSPRIPLPFDDGQWVQVRKLTGRESDAAQDAHRGQFASGNAKGWAVTFRRALEKGATDPDVLKALRDPLTGYDRHSVIRFGLVAWSYPQSIKPVAGKAATDKEPAVEAFDAIADLDDEAVDVIAREVMRLTRPGLFIESVEDAEQARKNG
jgi:hypothetical protein